MLLLTVFVLLCFLMTSFGLHTKGYEAGCSSFKEVVKSKAFVDKTMLIQTFFHFRRILITAPHNFGKSINMDMIRRFCELKVFTNGTTIAREETDNYRIFSKKHVKTNESDYLNVYKDKDFFNKHFGKFPVIYMNFKVLQGTSYDSFLDSFIVMISDLLDYHEYLLDNTRGVLSKRRVKKLNRFYNKIEEETFTKYDILKSTRLLSRLLYYNFNKKLIVLIDEYDTPLQKAIYHTGTDIDKIIYFMREFISNLLDSNSYVERALINACVRLSAAATTNNIRSFSFYSDHPFKTFYGFTLEEVFNLVERLNISDDIANIEDWYGGYSVAGNMTTLFNAYSVVCYLESKTFANFVVRSEFMPHPEKIFLNINISHVFHSLAEDKPVKIFFPTAFEVHDVKMLIQLVEGKNNNMLNGIDENFVFNFLIDLGYFTVNQVHDWMFTTLKIPNQEMYIELMKSFMS